MNTFNPPAFPVSTRSCDNDKEFGHQDSILTWQYSGMTLRDYFAAKALIAVLEQKDAHALSEYDSAAWMAYQISDAMLKARGEK